MLSIRKVVPATLIALSTCGRPSFEGLEAQRPQLEAKAAAIEGDRNRRADKEQ
jgi:hypothetical protein